MMRTVLALALLAAALGATTLALAQTAPAPTTPAPAAQTAPAPTQMAVRVAEAQRANAALMQQYSWTSRTEITDQGQVKDIRIELVNYGPSGMLQRTLMNEQGASLPMGFLRRAIAEHERQKLENYLGGLRGLIEQYTLPTAAKIQAFMNQAVATGPDATGLFRLNGQSVIVPGDNYTVWIDPKTHHLRRVNVGTYFQQDTVSVSATFVTLQSGLNHVSYADSIVPAKQISVQVQNFNYNRNN